jgi:hypothetical protein
MGRKVGDAVQCGEVQGDARRQTQPQYEYFMKGKKLATTEEEKDVGVYVTKNLKPSTHCHRVAIKESVVLNQLRKNFHYRDKRTFIKLYVQYVRRTWNSRHQPGHLGTRETRTNLRKSSKRPSVW